MPDESIREWSELEGALARQDWAEALRMAEAFEREWVVVRGLAEAFVGSGAGGWSQAIDDALEALIAALGTRPLSVAAVEAAMGRMREILGEHGARS